MKKNIEEEKKYLEDTLLRFKEIIEDTKLRIEAIPRIYEQNPLLLNSLLNEAESRLKLLNRTKEKPYFARIDFISDDLKKEEECYIGKVGVFDEDNNLVTVDWRAPIASLYYDSNIGPSSYKAPEGVITGNLTLKRQYDIENGKLLNFQDVDTVSNDEILKPYLGTNADSRLKNIVSTIQKEQNDIIRDDLNENIIIQGVAGSGKTTVALHRIAYLVYNNIKKIKPDQYLVIGPNKFFVNYISGVLPDLDVDNVSQLTYYEIVKELLEDNFEMLSDKDKILKSIENPEKLLYEKLKVSMTFKNILDIFIKKYDKEIIPNDNFSIKGYEILPFNIIKEVYDDVENEVIDYSIIAKKVERTIIILGRLIKEDQERILSNVNKQYYQNLENLSSDERLQEKKKIDYIEKELRNGCSQSLKKYFSKSTPKIIALYIEFLKKLNNNYIDNNYDISKEVKRNINQLKNKQVEFEDLASLMYLYYKIYGYKNFENYRQVVIDEAQDFGEFNFYALKQLMPKSSFSIFGDLAQSIYQYRGIDNWKDVINTTFNGNCTLKFLKKSYRTTTEIMNSANNITDYLNIEKAEPVIRHGIDVQYTNFENNQIDAIINIINEYQSKGFQSIAIICKDENEVQNINLELKKYGLNAINITDNDVNYQGGLCIITSYLAKGLEFDGVIISNASENRYNSSKKIDMKLLYVSMTRALHELNVLYDGELTLPLKKELNKDKIKQLAKK